MKKTLVALLIMICSLQCDAQNGQHMSYKFGYLYNKKKTENNGALFLIGDTSKKQLITIGSFINSGTPTLITKETVVSEFTYTRIGIAKKIKGTIVERNKDTLQIKFWDIIGNDPEKGNHAFVNSEYNNKDFAYVIKSWKRGRHFDIPFRFNQFMATSLPFRVLTKTGTLESDFLNANIAYLFVSGSSRVFKSEFVKTRTRYVAWGPYIGLSSIDNNVTGKEEFGINYGVNVVGAFQGFNLTVAYGFENGFHKATNEMQPYIGLGIGFKLLDTFTPEIKNK